MALQITTKINVDFYDKKYIMINAKQYDGSSRWISITCYDNGNLFNLSASKHTAYIRCRKSNGYDVFNVCRINHRGEVLVELTEQMLASDGICYVDLMIVNKGSAIVNVDTGEIITVDDSAIISTMAFCINVYETAVDNSLIESSYEYDALNDALQRAEADYTEVIQLAKSYAMGNANNIRENEDSDNSKYYSQLSRSYAIGDAGGKRENENTDNAKYYYEQSKQNSSNALQSATNAAKSEQNAKNSETNSSKSEVNARTSAANAKTYMDNAETYMNNAKLSETNASNSETNASNSASAALTSEQNAKESETISVNSASSASTSEQNAKSSETAAKDSEEKAHDYYELVKSVADGLNSGFIPMGTISFSELATAEKATGFTYNIRDDFVTNETFREGIGLSYTAGTNVYYTADGYWDCFGGSASSTATVDEVKEYLGI